MVVSTLLQSLQFALEIFEQLCPPLGLPRGLPRIEAEYVSSCTLSIAHKHFFDLQIVSAVGGLDLSITTFTGKNFLSNLQLSAKRIANDVTLTTQANLSKVLLRDQASVTDEDTPGEVPAPQVSLDLLDGARVHGVARKHPASNWQPVSRHGESYDDLWYIGASVLGVAANAQLVVAFFVLVVDLKVNGGCIVEDELNVGVEEVGDLEEHRLLEVGLALFEKVQSAIEVMELQLICLGKVALFSPMLEAIELRGRRETPVGHHEEQSPLQRCTMLRSIEAIKNRILESHLLPERL